MMVWNIWIILLVLFGSLILAITKLFKLSQKDVKFIDYFLYTFGSTIQPLLDHNWLTKLRSKSTSVALILLWLAISGFLIMNLYKTDLLSSLTAKSFEKPIDTIKDLVKSDIKKFHYKDESFYQLKDHPRKEFRELYEQVSENGWVVSSIAQIPMVLQNMYNGKGSFMSPRESFHYYMTNDIKMGKANEFKTLRIVKEIYRSKPSSVVLPKNGPITKSFDKIIMRMVDHGLYQKIVYKYSFRQGKIH